MITLTVAQISDLAEFAGLTIYRANRPSGDQLEEEITIAPCPPSGMKDDDGNVKHYAFVAYCTDDPEEGCMGLGAEVEPS